MSTGGKYRDTKALLDEAWELGADNPATRKLIMAVNLILKAQVKYHEAGKARFERYKARQREQGNAREVD